MTGENGSSEELVEDESGEEDTRELSAVSLASGHDERKVTCSTAPKTASKSTSKGKGTSAKPPTPTPAKGKGRATPSEVLPLPGDKKNVTPGEGSETGPPASATATSTPSVTAAGRANTPKGTVADYMLRSNRPYSCINVFDNMHKKIPKAMIQKLLDELTRDGTLKVQDYNKAKIYYANQDALPDGVGEVSDEKLKQLEQEAKDLTSRLEVASKEAGKAQSRVQALAAQPTDAELEDKLAESSREIEQMEARNGAIRGQGRSAVGGGMKAAKAEFNKFRGLWAKRKRNAMDVVDMIADGMDKKPKVVMDMLGLDVDEETVPPKL